MRLYHFTGAKFGHDDIVKRRLKVARIEDLNDPFELLAPTLSDPIVRHAFLETRKSMSGEFGFLCFSECWKDPVQWSHYAEGHRGLCLGFDVPESATTDIRYDSSRVNLRAKSMQRSMSNKAFVLKAATTKFEHWKYEQERRQVVELSNTAVENGLHFVHFSPDLVLREVIVGVRCTLSRADINSALGYLTSDVARFQARLAFRTFRVVRQRQESLWK